MAQQNTYPRFSLAQRIEHWVLFLSFTLLAVTGLPQKFADWGFADSIILLFGGIESTRTVHHIAAAVLALGSVYHLLILAYKVFVLRVRWTMFPSKKDLLDAIGAVRFNLGLTKGRPKLPRYSYEEKAEYWAMVWGTLIMGLTGFIVWNPINTARFIPGDLIPAAKAAHGAEAILAVLAILVWHVYNVHLKTFSKAVFTGNLDRHQMEEEHAQELEEIERGLTDQRPSRDVIKKRERVFTPIAAVCAIAMLGGVFWLLGGEQTALATVPRRAQVKAYVPLTPTPTTVPVASATQVPSSTTTTTTAAADSTTLCLSCHGPFENVVKASADYTFYDGSKVNPHTTVELTASKPHVSGKGVVACAKCHQPHPQPLASVKDVPSADLIYCFGCHHQGVFTPCSKCHEGYK